MHIRTMAIQINEKTWPVAVACLGGRFAARPFTEVEGAFLIINSPDSQSVASPYRRIGGPYGNRMPENSVTLGNCWLLEDDFRAMYQFDGRKSVENFFDVTKVAEPPLRENQDVVGSQIRQLHEAYFGDPEQD